MPQAARQLDPSVSARDRFGAELRRWRQTRGLSQAVLARMVHVSPDLVAKVEKAQRWPAADLVNQWDYVLETGGALAELWPKVASEREQSGRRERVPVDPELPGHWVRMLAVLATADNAVGVHGISSVVTKEIKIMESHRRSATGSLHIELCRVQARWLEFASWVSDNERRANLAEKQLKQAGSLADRIEDIVLAGYVSMRRAQRALETRRSADAVSLVAPLASDPRLPARVRALCAVRHAQARALGGDVRTARNGLAFAYNQLDRADDHHGDVALAGHCTRGYIRAHEAWCRLVLGDATAAVDEFHAVLTDWPPEQRLDESLFRAQLALATDATGEFEAADAEGLRALTLAQQTGSRRVLALLGTLAQRRIRAARSRPGSRFLGEWRAVQESGAS